MPVSIKCMDQAGIDFLVEQEGFRSKPYRDTNGIWTIGCGTTILPNGNKVDFNTPAITKNIAISYMNNYLNQIYKWIDKNLKWQPNQNQYNAICSFLYNLGLGTNLDKCRNTKRNLINGNINLIPISMLSVNNKGLLLPRRNREINLFNTEV